MPLQHLIFPSLHVLERSSHVAFIKSTRDFPLYNFSYSLCFELHLGTLFLLAPVVSLQYLVRSYKYSCIIYVCPHAISILQISPYSLLIFDNNSSCHKTYPSQNRVPIFTSFVVFLFYYQGLHQFSLREIIVTESNFFGEITTLSDP